MNEFPEAVDSATEGSVMRVPPQSKVKWRTETEDSELSVRQTTMALELRRFITGMRDMPHGFPVRSRGVATQATEN